MYLSHHVMLMPPSAITGDQVNHMHVGPWAWVNNSRLGAFLCRWTLDRKASNPPDTNWIQVNSASASHRYPRNHPCRIRPPREWVHCWTHIPYLRRSGPRTRLRHTGSCASVHIDQVCYVGYWPYIYGYKTIGLLLRLSEYEGLSFLRISCQKF